MLHTDLDYATSLLLYPSPIGLEIGESSQAEYSYDVHNQWGSQKAGIVWHSTAVSSEAWAKLRDWAIAAGRGRLLLQAALPRPLSKPL